VGCCAATPALDDAALLDRYLNDGDEAAIGILYLRYQGDLFRYGVARLGSDADARDLVQDTWEAVLTFRGLAPSGHFRGLLFRVAHNLVLQGARSRERRRAALAAFAWAGGQLQSGACFYCDAPAKERGMCSVHARRRERGATEAEMRKPIRRRT
jgi:DNA-directed RNA polymerase specialized sigma24 family protein